MKNLEEKYKNNQLSLDELLELRDKVNSMNGEILEETMCESWMNDDIDISNISSERMNRIKKEVDRTIGKKRSAHSLIMKMTQIAAVILLPVFIILSFYLYRENNTLSAEEMLVSTAKRERANITLPDGTQVTLNFDSKLGYKPKSYNREERNIHFEGEGYFQVAQNENCPFIIDSEGLQVKVLGTTFNLFVRRTSANAELFLEEGSVSFTSVKTGKSVTLLPNQMAILEYNTGKITVNSNVEKERTVAWLHGELIFRNEKFATVIQTIEQNYGMKITLPDDSYALDLFTGSLPVSDINEVLDILEKIYHLKSTIKDEEILMSRDDKY